MALEGMTDGAVLSGIPRPMALKFSAHAMMVIYIYLRDTFNSGYRFSQSQAHRIIKYVLHRKYFSVCSI